MKTEQILAQSKAAYGQWCVQWREHAKIHSKFEMKSLSDFENIGIGRAVLCVANGYSFEENIETIKKHQGNVDIICCDKTLGHLLDNGITPTFCMVCDANVDYEKYLAPWKDKVKDIILFNNVCGNIEWTEKAQWKDIYFFINKDILHSELEFSQISGCTNYIPAGTNVSNAMITLITQSDNEGRRNFFGYDKIILIGYDYSWRADGKYYAFSNDGDGKSNYMTHLYLIMPSGKYGYSSGNLAFSCQWLEKYVRSFNLPVVQCGKDSLLQFGKASDLADQMQYKFKTQDAGLVQSYVDDLKELIQKKKRLEVSLQNIGREHWYAHLSTI